METCVSSRNYKQNMGWKLKKGHVSNQLTNSPSRTIDETCIKIGPPKKKKKHGFQFSSNNVTSSGSFGSCPKSHCTVFCAVNGWKAKWRRPLSWIYHTLLPSNAVSVDWDYSALYHCKVSVIYAIFFGIPVSPVTSFSWPSGYLSNQGKR